MRVRNDNYKNTTYTVLTTKSGVDLTLLQLQEDEETIREYLFHLSTAVNLVVFSHFCRVFVFLVFYLV